jgi:hypothetical protein
MDKINPLFTATVTAIGGRNGSHSIIARLLHSPVCRRCGQHISCAGD